MTTVAALQAHLESILDAVVGDGRRCFARLRDADDGGVILECSDEPVLHALLPRMRDVASPRAVRGAMLPLAHLAGRAACVAASVADVRREPRHAAEQITQALQGEILEPLTVDDGWSLCRLEDGYLGWVRDWHLVLDARDALLAQRARHNARVAAHLVALRERPAAAAAVVGETLLGTAVTVLEQRDGWRKLELPGGRAGWVESKAVRDGVAPRPARAGEILATLHAFRGVPYVWGGKSPKGFDCSGLVQFVFALHGVALPRDSDQQYACGRDVEQGKAGDLVFFGRERITHVGVLRDAQTFIHARGEVRLNSLAAGAALYDAELAGQCRGIRRVLPHSAV